MELGKERNKKGNIKFGIYCTLRISLCLSLLRVLFSVYVQPDAPVLDWKGPGEVSSLVAILDNDVPHIGIFRQKHGFLPKDSRDVESEASQAMTCWISVALVLECNSGGN